MIKEYIEVCLDKVASIVFDANLIIITSCLPDRGARPGQQIFPNSAFALKNKTIWAANTDSDANPNDYLDLYLL